MRLWKTKLKKLPVGHASSGVQSVIIFPDFIDAYCNMRGWPSFIKYGGRPEGSASLHHGEDIGNLVLESLL
jgi:hypothetical protein